MRDIAVLSPIVPEGAAISQAYLRFRPARYPEDAALIRSFWEDAWRAVHGNLDTFDAVGLLSETERLAASVPGSVVFAMLGDREAGLLVLDTMHLPLNSGHIFFFTLHPDFRGRHLAVQLLGQAVSFCRKLGRRRLTLRVAGTNIRALSFYEINGFSPVIGAPPDRRGLLTFGMDI
ncbi:GNAT family N-acetyltransferase [Oscillospiraceae bacterium OttesenSCG-928-F05]|nr:GNAT family N-acetyltransferase [Oscillospiraceae bacterium OttesenSCG-928-F05]